MEKDSRLLTEEAGGDGKTSQSTDRSSSVLRFRTFPVFSFLENSEQITAFYSPSDLQEGVWSDGSYRA